MLNVLSSPANGAAIPDVPCAERRITCGCGAKPIPSTLPRPQIAVWIRSPRTGNTVVIPDHFFVELDRESPRLRCRIIHAASMGRHSLEFTVSDLKAIARVAALVAESLRPKAKPVGVYSGYRFKPGRRRGWINR